MATHAQNIANLRNAVYGEQVRGSMIELFEEDYNLVKDGVGIGTAVSSSSSSTAGFSDGAVYINNSTWHIFKLEGTAWSDKGIIKGDTGASVVSAHDNGDGTFYLTLSDGTVTANIATIQGIQGPTGPQGPAGSTGPAGRSVTSIQMTGTGKQHPIIATYSDATTETVGIVQDGADGTGTGDMSKSTYDPSDHGYVDAAAGVTNGTNTLSYTTLNNKADKATSLAGYGITDAYTKTETDDKFMQLPGSGVASGKVAMSNGSSGFTWETPPSGVTALKDLTTDVTISTASLAANQILKYNGSKWVNSKDALANLSDVVISSATSGQSLMYNGSNWVNDTPDKDEWIGPKYADSNYNVVFDNLNNSYGYDLFAEDVDVIKKSLTIGTGTASGTKKATFVVDSTNVVTGSSGTKFYVRAYK